MVHQALKNKMAWKLGVSCLGACLLAAGTAARADSNPYYIGGSLGVNHVSNVYRTSNNPNSDTVTTASLLAGVDQQIGRQHLVVDGSLSQARYANNSQLNNNGYSLRGVLDWQTIERISGTLSASMNRQLANYNASGTNTEPVTDRNIENDRQLAAVVRVGLVTRWSAQASFTHYSQDFSLEQYNALDFSQNATSLGLVYKPSDLLRLGVALRHTTGEYPHYPVLGTVDGVHGFYVYERDPFTRRDVDLTADWQPTGSSHLNARLSWTDSKHDVVDALNYKGLTGQIGWTYNPGGRWSVSTQLIRDTGEQASLLGPSQNRVGNTLQLNGSYELTSKIMLTGSASLRRGSSSDTNGLAGYDNDRSVSLGLRYAYSRSLSMSCQVFRSGRTSNSAVYNYDANGFGCTAQTLLY